MERSTLIGRSLAAGFVMLVGVACSEPTPTSRPPDEVLREHIHAATGHEPPACTDFAKGDALITITETGFEPDCLMVNTAASLTVVNETSTEHTFMVSDGADSLVVRHIRVEEAIPPGGEYVLDPVESLIGEEIYPFWSKGYQEQGYGGTLIVRP